MLADRRRHAARVGDLDRSAPPRSHRRLGLLAASAVLIVAGSAAGAIELGDPRQPAGAVQREPSRGSRASRSGRDPPDRDRADCPPRRDVHGSGGGQVRVLDRGQPAQGLAVRRDPSAGRNLGRSRPSHSGEVPARWPDSRVRNPGMAGRSGLRVRPDEHPLPKRRDLADRLRLRPDDRSPGEGPRRGTSSPPGYQLQTLDNAGRVLATDPFNPGM